MIVRIASVDLEGEKQVRFALTKIVGIGKSNVKRILAAVKISPTKKIKDLSEEEINKIRAEMENISVEEDLVRERKSNIKRLVDIKTYRGDRHRRGLPVRGQTTKTNSRTRRGNKRMTAGSGRAKAEGKT